MNSLTFVTDPLFILLVGIVAVVSGIIWLRMHAFVALILAAYLVAILTPEWAVEQYGLAMGLSPEAAEALAGRSIGSRIAGAFGNTTAQIGILIAMAAIIGKCLLESGGAERIVRSLLRVTGEDKAPVAFVGSSFFLGIPVFFDTVFYLMIPLAKALAARLKRNYLLFVLTIAAGASMAHSLVPPTPGPLFLVSEMGIPIHMMMIGGAIIGIFTVTAGYFYAVWANRRWDIPLRSSPDAPLEEMEKRTQQDISQLPGLWFSMLPILVPLILISVNGFLGTLAGGAGELPGWIRVIIFAGEKNTALIIGGILSLALLARQYAGDGDKLSSSMQQALLSGGVIILITAAGGAFGAMLQQTGISIRIADLTEGFQMALIPLAFFITAVVRMAQGSATVSMITASGILAGLAAEATLGYHMLYLGLAIACGSKLIPWMNDSGFWIVTNISNLTTEESLKTFSVMSAIMGITGLVVIYIGALLFPLV